MSVTCKAEYTDLFCSQLNYSHVTTVEFECDGLTDLQIVRRAKKLLGLNGYPMRRVIECGDYIQLNSVSGLSAVAISFIY